ncbi:MAG: hypothetical protein DRO11_08150 [Methanobacteriota archaeon]|nr:MAG: hypothetical protein DRO11_08150 [Euryarchaeota archaeon]
MGVGIGTVISTPNGPRSGGFSFVVTSDPTGNVSQGEFIQVETPPGLTIACVTEVYKTNRYFDRAETVREWERRGENVENIFPVGKWEYMVADARCLALYNQTTGELDKPRQPVSPGSKVYQADEEILEKLLGLDPDGLEIGYLQHHNTPVKLNLTRTFQKHAAILAMSGAGKSYLASVLIEELLDRRVEGGRVGVVVFDTHGEYTSFGLKPTTRGEVDYSDRCVVVDASKMRLATPHLTAFNISEYAPDMSSAQMRELSRVLEELREDIRTGGGGSYTLEDVCCRVEQDNQMPRRTKEALLSWLYDLSNLRLFHDVEEPVLEDVVAPGLLTVFDMSKIIDLRKKQVLLSYAADRLFTLRRDEQIPPFVMVVEEAHQYAPESSFVRAISRRILETIAREGRKFSLALLLISQRPVRLSTTVLSQCNTQFILRVNNPYDLDHLGRSSEGITRETLNTISSLPVGEVLVVGEAVNHPIFVRVRKRRSPEGRYGISLEEAARRYEQRNPPDIGCLA